MTVPRSHIQAMAPYALADLNTSSNSEVVSLSQNESFRPPSPKVAEKVLQTVSRGMLYPDPDWSELRLALAQTHRIEAGQILCGNGSLNLIAALVNVYSGPDRAVLAPAHAYPYFKTAALTAGARFDTALEVKVTVSVSSVLEAVQADTGLVCIANPGNPTGTRISKDELKLLRRELREDILLLIDEAYGEYADHLDEGCFDMVATGNTVILRTFSKAYGMAGYRVGWGLFPDVIAQEVRKVLNPNNVSLASQAAALAALEDRGYMQETCRMTKLLRERAAVGLRSAGFHIHESFTNFLLIDCTATDCAERLEGDLRKNGILLRRQAAAGLPHAVRMTIGAEYAITRAVRILTEWKEANSR